MVPADAPRRSRSLLLGGAALAAALLWWASRGDAPQPAATGPAAGADPGADRAGLGFGPPIRRGADGRWGASWRAPGAARAADGLARVTGTVIDQIEHKPVGGVEVVFSGADGETSTTANADGTYQIDVPGGAYHAFVRGDGVMSVATAPPERLPGAPTADDVDAPASELAPLLTVASDESGVDLPVAMGGKVTGKVVDRAGHPVAHALVRARGAERPLLGTDVAETDASGAYALEIPAGSYALDASHPDYAGLENGYAELDLLPGTRQTSLDLTMVAGCIVRGHVVGADGAAAGDGAIEGRAAEGAEGDDGFGPVGHIEPDGSFRWTTVATVDLDLRAWPWKSPPSPSQRFHCTEGARYDVTFALGRSSPDADGTIATADGRPAAGAFLDVMGLSAGTQSQQERADGDGKWAVYALPAGDYQVSATVDGEGTVTQKIHVPAHGVALALGGTGALVGTVKGVGDGAIAMSLDGCDDGGRGPFERPTTRLVPVHGGQFRLDGVPACKMSISARTPEAVASDEVDVHANRDATVELDLTPPHKVAVSGRVVRADGSAAAGAMIEGYGPDGGDSMATADASGRFTITTTSGSSVAASADGQSVIQQIPTGAPDAMSIELHLVPSDEEYEEGEGKGEPPVAVDDGPIKGELPAAEPEPDPAPAPTPAPAPANQGGTDTDPPAPIADPLVTEPTPGAPAIPSSHSSNEPSVQNDDGPIDPGARHDIAPQID